ncbi:hypothetical protein GCM10010394_46940 [Streptomyces crystallinus]|uniref:Transposase n=1 Tax=Streptomyces crystallinus TaxID=68191 RepID=A0ABN1GHP3_9ACTN
MTEPHALFPYTSLASWQEIVATGQIRPTSLAAEHIDSVMPLLWLTDSTNPADTALSDPGRTQIRTPVFPEAGIRYWRMWKHLVPNVQAREQWGEPACWYQRNAVERCINRFKQWRGLAMRTDKLAIAYLAAFHLAAILIWARR